MDSAILKFFEGIRSPALTVVFGIFSALGEGIVVGAAVVLLFWLFPKIGERILFTAVSSAALNSALKTAVRRPRPYAAGVVALLEVDTPVFSTLNLGDDLSFPSGHAQATSSAFLAGALGKKRKALRAATWVAFALIPLLVICSRLYFGVHYPTDLIAGYLIGVAVSLFWHLVFRYAYRLRFYFLSALAAAAVVYAFFTPEKEYLEMAALLAGGAVFLPLVSFLRVELPKNKWRRLWRIPVGIVCAGAVYALFLLFPKDLGLTFLKWFLLFGAGTAGAFALFKVLKI